MVKSLIVLGASVISGAGVLRFASSAPGIKYTPAIMAIASIAPGVLGLYATKLCTGSINKNDCLVMANGVISGAVVGEAVAVMRIFRSFTLKTLGHLPMSLLGIPMRALDYVPVQVIPKQLRENWADYTAISSVLITAYFVNACWEKVTIIVLGFAAVSALSLLNKQPEAAVHHELNAFSQASAAAAIAGLCLVKPPLAAGLAAALSVHILARERKLASIAKENAKSIETLQAQNTELSRIYQEIKETAERLEAELNVCLTMPGQIQQIVQNHVEATDLVQGAEQTTALKMDKLKAKMDRLASLCQHAAAQKHLLERIRTAGRVEQDLTSLTLQCSQRQQELANLNQEIGALKGSLEAVISSLSAQDGQVRARVQELTLQLSMLSKSNHLKEAT